MVNESASQMAGQRLSADEGAVSERLVPQVISAFDQLARSGLLGGSRGDVSIRVPGTGNVLITPLTPFVEEVTAEDLLEVSLAGRILHKHGRPTFLMQMHLAIYKQRADVQAIVHSHAPVATVLGLCELPIPPVTFDAVPFVELPRVPVLTVLNSQWAQDVAARLAGGAPAALLLNNGIVTVGEDLRQAVNRTLALEETARILVLCYLMQQVPVALPASAVEILRDALL